MSDRLIASSHNPRYRAWRRLAESAEARRETGLVLLDGEHLLESCLAAGGRPDEILVTDEVERARWQARLPEADVARLPRHLFDALSPVRSPTGVMAVVRPPAPAAGPVRFGVLLERIQDPGNLGAMLRSAAAAGVDTVWLSSGCADLWSPKVLRGGMGAHFVLRLQDGADLPVIAQAFPGTVLATAPLAPVSLYETELHLPLAFAFGNEGVGLSPALLSAVSQPVHIPMPGRMESLNAAAALAVCLFEAVRQQPQCG